MLGGGQLAPLAPQSIDALNKVLPPFWSHGNPIDVLGDATPTRYKQAVEICAKDPNVQGLLILLTPQAMTDPTLTAREIAPFAKIDGKPVLASWMGGVDVRAGRAVLAEAGVASFDSPEAAINAFLHMVQYRRAQELLYEQPAALPEDWRPDQARVRAIIDAVRKPRDEQREPLSRPRTLLTEFEAKNLLASYGIPTVPTVNATSADEAVAAATQFGYPVVLKLWSEVITHKSDAGGVMLNLANADAVRSAFAEIQRNASEYAKRHTGALRDLRTLNGEFLGATVQPMIRIKGYELIVGSSVDPQFGPTILFGAGGVLVEVFKDSALGLPPLNRTLARRLIERTQIFKALQGVRGQTPISLDELEMLLVRFSYLLCDFPEIQEIDINPLLASPERLIALDARVLLAPPDAAPSTLAIEPYPNQHTTSWQLKDGTPVTIRAIRPEDEPLITRLHNTLSEQSIRFRFFSMVKTLSRESLIRLCHLDYSREMALVAERNHEIIGVSRYYMNPQTQSAEFAIVVSDASQGQGLGDHLMRRLIVVARERGVQRLTGSVLRENHPMLALAKELGFHETPSRDPGVVQVALDL
jgi:acetyltransferase